MAKLVKPLLSPGNMGLSTEGDIKRDCRQEGRLLSTLPASGDASTSGVVWDLAWDDQGNLLVGQRSPHRLDCLTMDQDSGQLLKTTILHTDQHEKVSSVSINNRGDVGAVIYNTGVSFSTTKGHNSGLWLPDPQISELHNIVMLTDKFCVCSCEAQSIVYVYSLEEKSLFASIHLHNENFVDFVTAVTDDRIVISEYNTGILYIVDLSKSQVTRVVPREHPGGEKLLSESRGVASDEAGHIYICDCEKNKVFVLSPEGQFLTTLGGDLDGSLKGPGALAVRVGKPGQRPLLALSEYASDQVKVFTLH